MTIRRATKADQSVLRALWEDFEDELGGEEYLRETWEEAWEDLAQTITAGVALIAEEDGDAVGFVFCVLGDRGRKTAHVTDIYVRPDVRDRGVGRARCGHHPPGSQAGQPHGDRIRAGESWRIRQAII